MKPWIKTIIVFVVLALIYWLAQICISYYHESVHQAIYSSYNINSTIKLDFSGGGMTYAEKACPLDSTCDILHNWNEIVTYNMSAFLFNIWGMIIFVIIWKYWDDGIYNGRDGKRGKRK